MTPQHTKSCASHPDSTQYHQPCSCSVLDKEIEAFEKEFVRESVFGISIGAIDSFKGTAKNQVREFLRQSLPRFTRSVIEQAMPEERGTKSYSNSHDAIANSDKDYGFNACRTQFTENVERILKDEKEI